MAKSVAHAQVEIQELTRKKEALQAQKAAMRASLANTRSVFRESEAQTSSARSDTHIFGIFKMWLALASYRDARKLKDKGVASNQSQMKNIENQISEIEGQLLELERYILMNS